MGHYVHKYIFVVILGVSGPFNNQIRHMFFSHIFSYWISSCWGLSSNLGVPTFRDRNTSSQSNHIHVQHGIQLITSFAYLFIMDLIELIYSDVVLLI